MCLIRRRQQQRQSPLPGIKTHQGSEDINKETPISNLSVDRLSWSSARSKCCGSILILYLTILQTQIHKPMLRVASSQRYRLLSARYPYQRKRRQEPRRTPAHLLHTSTQSEQILPTDGSARGNQKVNLRGVNVAVQRNHVNDIQHRHWGQDGCAEFPIVSFCTSSCAPHSLRFTLMLLQCLKWEKT